MVEITSPDSFSIDNVPCSDVGLYCDTPPVQSMQESRITEYRTGSDEDYAVDDDSYGDIQLKFVCYVFAPDNFDTSAVYQYLRSGKKLRYSRNSGYYYKIKDVKCSAVEKYDGKRLKYTITFTVAPFKFIDNEEVIELSSGGIVNGSGTRYSKPLYKLILGRQIAGSTFTVNGQQFIIDIPLDVTIADGILYLDAENDIVYDKAGNNCMMYTTGDIQYMSTGQNSISWTGDITSVTIKRNGRCY